MSMNLRSELNNNAAHDDVQQEWEMLMQNSIYASPEVQNNLQDRLQDNLDVPALAKALSPYMKDVAEQVYADKKPDDTTTEEKWPKVSMPKWFEKAALEQRWIWAEKADDPAVVFSEDRTPQSEKKDPNFESEAYSDMGDDDFA